MEENFRWSDEVRQLREKLTPQIERLLKLMDQEKIAGGLIDAGEEDFTDVQGQYLLGWVVAGEMQPLNGSSEESAVLAETSGVTAPTAIGLLTIARETWLGK